MSDYQIIAKVKWEEVKIYIEYWDYQWTFIMVTEKDWVLKIYKDYFGSCSWCDNFEWTFSRREQEAEDFLTSAKLAEFVAQYEPFLVRNISELTRQDLYDWITMNTKDSWDFKKDRQEELVNQLCDMYFII